MNIVKKIESLSVKQLVLTAVVIALIVIAWRNKELIRAKIEQ